MEQLHGSYPEPPDVYVNSVRIGVGLYDFTFEMGLQGMPDAPGSERPPIKNLVRVRMSPQHAYMLYKLLRKNVDAYRDKVGPILIPDQVLEELELPKDD